VGCGSARAGQEAQLGQAPGVEEKCVCVEGEERAERRERREDYGGRGNETNGMDESIYKCMALQTVTLLSHCGRP